MNIRNAFKSFWQRNASLVKFMYKPQKKLLSTERPTKNEGDLAPRVLSLSLRNFILNLATKCLKLKYSEKKIPNFASIARTFTGASNMKNALNICTSCQILRHSNGCPELDELFSLLHIFVVWRKFYLFKCSGSAKNKNNATEVYHET